MPENAEVLRSCGKPTAEALTALCKQAKLLRAAGDVAADYAPTDSEFRNVLPLLAASSGPLETAEELNKSSAVDASDLPAREDDLVDKGMGAFVQKLGDGLPVCLNSRVTKIEYPGEGSDRHDVKIYVDGGKRVYRSSTAVVTVSVGVLKRSVEKRAGAIQFDPELPQEKQDAIEHLQMGNMQKVIVPFSTDVFGNTKPNSWLVYEGDLPAEAIAFAHTKNLPVVRVDGKTRLVIAFVIKPIGKNIAIAFFGGDWAKALEGQCAGKESGSGLASSSGCDKLAIQIARAGLSKMFGGEKDEDGKSAVDKAILEKQIQVTRWSLDPTSFGAYSVAEPGHWMDHQTLGEPIEAKEGQRRLFFAGEGTALGIYSGAYPGAYESGLKAAREINEELLIAKEKKGN